MASIRWLRCIFVGILVLYINLVLTNVVSWRQAWYARKYNNGTSLEPLYDSMFMDWFHGYRIPIPHMLTLRDMATACTYIWVICTVIVWAVWSRKPELLAKFITAQILIISVFAPSQLLTIVPDATKDCLVQYNIPMTESYDWVFWNYPIRACGNMLWSSDIAQLVIFTSLATQMVPPRRQCFHRIVWIVGELWIWLTAAFIFTAKYQYTMDVFTTILVVKLILSHPKLTIWSRYLFVKNAEYHERVPTSEYELSRAQELSGMPSI